MGNKGAVSRPRCIGTERAQTQLLLYSILQLMSYKSVAALSPINPVHAITLYFFMTHFNIILPCTPRSTKRPPSLRLPKQILHCCTPPYVPHLMRSTDHETLHQEVSPSSCKFHPPPNRTLFTNKFPECDRPSLVAAYSLDKSRVSLYHLSDLYIGCMLVTY
jgi:hypothetical protein